MVELGQPHSKSAAVVKLKIFLRQKRGSAARRQFKFDFLVAKAKRRCAALNFDFLAGKTKRRCAALNLDFLTEAPVNKWQFLDVAKARRWLNSNHRGEREAPLGGTI